MTQYRPVIPIAVPYVGLAARGEWRSATPMSFEYLGLTEPFMINSLTQFRPGPPPPMQSMDRVRQYDEAKTIGSAGVTRTLTLFFGTDEKTFSIPGATVSRNYTSFSQAAKEVVEVRIMQGIHFREAEDESLKLGGRVADWGWHKYLGGTYGKPEGAPTPWVVEDARRP